MGREDGPPAGRAGAIPEHWHQQAATPQLRWIEWNGNREKQGNNTSLGNIVGIF